MYVGNFVLYQPAKFGTKIYTFRSNRSLCVGVFFMAHPVYTLSTRV